MYTYEQKLKIADQYLDSIVGGIGWEDLPDINSLHDCETKEDIIEATDERLHDDMPPFLFE